MVNHEHEREQKLQIPPDSTKLNSSNEQYDFYARWVKSGKNSYTVTTYRKEKKTGKVDIASVQQGVSKKNLTEMTGSLIG